MSDFPIGLREVVPNQTVPEKCREFTINTGGAQSTLQDIKLPDSAGGFAYEDNGKLETRNRFIMWRTSHDVLELVEKSMDSVLIGNRVRYRFQDTPILSGGVGIFESFGNVIVLVATVSSVHKMVFRHPARLRGEDFDLASSLPSVFYEATASTPKENCHMIPAAGTCPLPHAGATWLDSDDEALFALANATGSITLIKLGNLKGIVTSNPLKSASYLGRLWGNLGGILSRGAGPNEGGDAAMSLVIHPVQNDLYVFALCKDHKIRMWLASTYDCVMVVDVINMAGGGEGSMSGNASVQKTLLHQGAQSHILRKVSDPQRKGSFALAVFLCFAQHSQFCVFRPVRVDGQFKLKPLATVYAPEFDLIDFAVTPSGYLVALWTNPDGLPVLRYTCFNSDLGGMDSRTGWSNVYLEEPLDADFSPPENTQYDPRQAYLHQIFYPGRFSMQTLAKTVSIYRRSLDLAGSLTDESMSMEKLKEEVCSAVENEIRNQISEFEITDEEHIAISHASWSKFYSCAIQYHEAGLKPMGLVCDERTGLLSIVKKSGHSFIRPVDAIEHLVLTGGGVDTSGPELFYDTPILCGDPALAQDVINLMRAISLVGSLVTPGLADEFSHALQRLVSPDIVARKLVMEILTDESDGEVATAPNFTQELSTRLQQVGDIPRALEVLLMSLELDRGIVSHSDLSNGKVFDIDDDESDGIEKIFASPMGVSVIAESLNQMAVARFELSRDLIVLQLLMLQCNLPDGLSPSSAELIHSTYLPRSVVMAHSYFVLVWVTETTSTTPPADSLEQGLRQMAVLKISDQHSGTSQQVTELARNCLRPLTLSELFLMGPGRIARNLLTSDTRGQQSTWNSILMPLVSISAQLLWPRCAVPTFQEFLLSACQHLQIQEYVRLLSTWCDWNCQSRQFLLGSALLNMGEPEKACDWMIQAASGVKSDRFLSKQLFPDGDVTDGERLSVLYFLKVIQLFEQFGYYDCVIDLAKTAAAICDENDPDKTTLCYILFSYHLKLGHNDEAYDAMVSNPDQTRRKDSLRQFIVTLFERKQLKQLAAYPYIDMFEDLESVIESRARSVDLTVNSYYEFLYSFHIAKENYRKAAHVMYECGMRLNTEVFNLDGLKRQAKCYLSCINALKLVNPSYAWIVKPVLQKNNSEETSSFSFSPKHTHDGMEINQQPSTKPRLEVLEMAEIQKDFQLVCARLKLANKCSDLTGPSMSPVETVALLVSANLFDDAVNLAKLFNLDQRMILEGLAMKCVILARARTSEQEAAWEWLAEYSQSGTKGQPSSSIGQDYRLGGGAAVETAWNLLRSYLSVLEPKGQSSLHKAVVTKLMSMGAFLPAWLVSSYQLINPAELLRLYLVHGYLQDASKLTCEYVSAVLGHGKEYFGINAGLHGSGSPVWLPHNLIDQLLLELRENSQDPAYHKLYLEVNKVVENYLNIVSQVSKDMIEMRRRMIT